MHSVITEAQCVTNEKFNETLSMDQGQGLRRIMKSLISSRSMGRFSLLHSTDTCGILYYPELHSCATEQRQHNSEKKRHYRLMTGNTNRSVSHDTAVFLIILSGIFLVLQHVQMILSWIIQVTAGISLDFFLNLRSQCRIFLSRIHIKVLYNCNAICYVFITVKLAG